MPGLGAVQYAQDAGWIEAEHVFGAPGTVSTHNAPSSPVVQGRVALQPLLSESGTFGKSHSQVHRRGWHRLGLQWRDLGLWS